MISTEQPKSLLAVHVGEKLPTMTLFYLDRNGTVRAVTLSSLCKGKNVVLGWCFRRVCVFAGLFFRAVELAKAKSSDLVACVAVNDVFVMSAWGQRLAVSDGIMMLSDSGGVLLRSPGVSFDTSNKPRLGLGAGSKRFCLTAINGVITSIDFNGDDIMTTNSTVF